MTFDSGIESSRLSVLLDLRHPFAYLALGPSAALATEVESDWEINWLPIAVPPLHPPSTASPDDDRGFRHRRYRAQAIAREIETYSRAEGLAMREYYRDGSAEAVNLGWLWLRERQPDQLLGYLGAVFRAYWALELDAASEAEVAALIDSLVGGGGGEYRAWCADAGLATLALLSQELRARRLSGTPCYLLGDEVFLGRQHLPMIRWILAGRSGPGPI